MIGSLALLLGCLAAGEVLAAWTGLPVPGAITGMGILLAGLAVRGSIGPSLKGTAKGLLAHLALLLVPAGAGIVLHLARLREEWLAISAALLASTALTLATTAVTFRLVSRLLNQEPGAKGAQ
jgi:holin-like protein